MKGILELGFDFWCNQRLIKLYEALPKFEIYDTNWPKLLQLTYVVLQLLTKHGVQELLVTSDGNKLENMEHGSVEGGKIDIVASNRARINRRSPGPWPLVPSNVAVVFQVPLCTGHEICL